METYLQQSDILNATLVGLGRGTGGQGSAKEDRSAFVWQLLSVK